jgi:WD40 repeat protein
MARSPIDPVRVLNGHDKDVVSLAFSADGKRLASGGLDNQAVVWDVAKGEDISTVDCRYPVKGVALDREGKRLCTGGWGAQVWDADKGERKHHFESHTGFVTSASQTDDALTFATGALDGTVVLHNIPGLQEGRTFQHGEQVLCIAFSHSGKLIASAGDRFINIWNVGTGTLAKKLDIPGILSISFSPKDDLIALAKTDKKIALIDASTYGVKLELVGHTDTVRAVAFSSKGDRIVSGSTDKTVRVWDSASGKQVAEIAAHEGAVNAVAFSPDGKLIASASVDKLVKLWDATKY